MINERMKLNKPILYFVSVFVLIGIIAVLQFYFSHNYDEYGLLDRQYLGDIADCQNCLIIETKDSQYSYFFGLYTVIDKTPKIYYFKNEHALRTDFNNPYTKWTETYTNPMILKIHWHKINYWCCIQDVKKIGYLYNSAFLMSKET